MLAGGAGRRLGGTPKGLELVGGRRIIDRVVSVLSGASDRILVCSGALDARYWLDDVEIITDIFPGFGGMSGIHSALSLGADVLAVAWDMPFVDGLLLRHLKTVGEERNAAAVVPESDSPYGIEPFCAWYSGRAFPAFDRFLQEGGGAARHLIASLPNVVRVPVEVTRRFGDPATMFLSVNTPEDLARARAVADAAG